MGKPKKQKPLPEKLVIINGVEGYKKCPEWLKKVYRRSTNYVCQLCHKSEKEVGTLEIHRIKRRYRGGLYTIYRFTHKKNNVKVICKKCHKQLHSNEQGHGSHSY